MRCGLVPALPQQNELPPPSGELVLPYAFLGLQHVQCPVIRDVLQVPEALWYPHTQPGALRWAGLSQRLLGLRVDKNVQTVGR